jgi:hypothetical protein
VGWGESWGESRVPDGANGWVSQPSSCACIRKRIKELKNKRKSGKKQILVDRVGDPC